MTNRAFVLGFGQIGRAVSAELVAHDWQVTVGKATNLKDPTEGAVMAPFAILDRRDGKALALAIGDGFDLVVDTIAFDRGDAEQWASLAGRLGKLVVISSLSVYADADGRTLDEAWSNGPPCFALPIPETNRRVAPGPQTYSTRKAAMEDAVMALDLPTAIIRPGAVFGIGCRSPREWWFVQQVLAGRDEIPLAWNGTSRFHPIASENLAEIVRLAAEAEGSQLINAGDLECPDVMEIGQSILAALGSAAQLRPFEGPPQGFIGLSPWTIAHPMVADLAAAQRLGYSGRTTYRNAMPATCRDLVERAGRLGWRKAFPGLAPYPPGFFID
jgi:nucleoside-diphosphate-sugar epimerase